MDKLQRLNLDDNLKEKFSMKVSRRKASYTFLHWHDFYEIEICTKGTATTEINGKTYPFSEGTVSFTTPKDFHCHNSDSELDIVNFTFAPSCVEHSGFSELLSLNDYIVCNVDKNTLSRLLYLIDEIEREYSDEKKFSKQYTLHLLACILIELVRLSKRKDNNKDISFLPQKALYYVQTHFKEPITLEDVAEFTGLTPDYISKLFRKHIGSGFKEYLTKLRLSHAEQLLLYSDESISNISYFCGFNSLSHFLNAFKKKYDVSPGNFRKNNK